MIRRSWKWRDDRGATAIEYGLIIALVTLVMIIGLTQFGNATTLMYNNVTAAIVGAR